MVRLASSLIHEQTATPYPPSPYTRTAPLLFVSVLLEGPASVEAFDFIARVTGRVIIATTK